MNKANAKIILDAKSKEEKKRIFLAVTHERKTRQYSLDIDMKLTREEFNNPRLKVTKDAIELARPHLDKAIKIINDLGEDFSFISFMARFKEKRDVSTMSKEINDIFSHYVEEHRNLAQGTIDNYKTIITHLNNFKPGIKITDLNIDMLLKLQEYIRNSHLKKTGNQMSETTMSIYMRALRAIYKYAEVHFDLSPKQYPFGKNKISISNSPSSHRAMTDEDFKKLTSYHPINKNEEFAYDMFFISFGLAGMNTADIISIKNKNIDNTKLEFIREKTKNRTEKRNVIQLDIPDKVYSLINKYASLCPDSPEEYIFPFFTNKMSEKQRLRKRKDVNKKINKNLKEICDKLGIEPVTTYWARHTIATKLYNAGQTSSVISKLLGHSSTKTTDNYLGQLGLTKMKEVETNISSFLANLDVP